jgi:hypothetical protein
MRMKQPQRFKEVKLNNFTYDNDFSINSGKE